ncbi:MAG: 2-C-methyl-D-erythritol 2,4-cyclodiphosphate synthase [Gammaproteobacteria bacterium]|nr:2-C-methyl-D-erythritol 2,4-cyclodiphosphate synthase [Gammaproteobacteria bacterium]MCP5135848.1 2-C-methyl-D-erythritol 2,4-cyclodiphosphate synthase [Gammaproteobacteria bacterium]
MRTGLGQDSHRFLDDPDPTRPLLLGGIEFDGRPLNGNSDADVVLHAITNAVSSVTGINVIGKTADTMCRQGITDSAEYLQVALTHLGGLRISHLAISIECLTPKISPRIDAMKAHLAELLGIHPSDIGITATTGEGLTGMGRGEGVQVLAILTVFEE